MSMWKPTLNHPHFDRMHKTQPHQEKSFIGKQHEGMTLSFKCQGVGSGIRRLKNQIRCHCIRHFDTA